MTRDKPPGVRDTFGQAIASTLIHGVRDAVLVDAFLMVNQAKALADWVAARGKNLTTIYITHRHGDHWFGVGTLLERFPKARAVATRNAVKKMHQQASPDALARWQASFPGQIPDRLVIAEELEGDVIDLEGRELVAVELGHTDTDSTTCLHVPCIGLVVAGDAVYNDFTFISSNQIRRHGGSGSLHSTKSSRSIRAQSSHRISDRNATTIPGPLKRPGSTSAISAASRRRRRAL